MPPVVIPRGSPVPAGGLKRRYSFQEIKQLWVSEGGNPAKATIAAAVAMAESRGDSLAQHKNSDGSTDRGLWQINSVHGAMSTVSPRGNAQAAIRISRNGVDWRPWVTFKNGAYQTFLNPARQNDPIPSVDVPGAIGDAVGGAVDAVTPEPLKEVGKFVSRLGVIFEADWWKRAGMVLAGVIAIVIAIIVVAKEYMPANLPIPIIP